MYTSSERRRKVLWPASRMARSRHSRVVVFKGSTTLILYGSAHERRFLSDMGFLPFFRCEFGGQSTHAVGPAQPGGCLPRNVLK
jgi:hypothetical protein